VYAISQHQLAIFNRLFAVYISVSALLNVCQCHFFKPLFEPALKEKGQVEEACIHFPLNHAIYYEIEHGDFVGKLQYASGLELGQQQIAIEWEVRDFPKGG